MSRLGHKSVVYFGDSWLGELDAIPAKDSGFQFPGNEIRIHHISPVSERCPPLSILQTISAFSVKCKLEPAAAPVEHQSPLIHLHASCFYELKTAVVMLGDEEIHLVAMPSKLKKFPCFWCYSVPKNLYAACLRMLNMRCLAIVFDLDETLIVANTMRSFEDRIEALRGWIVREMDPVRASGMSAELKRYMEDRSLLKQYTESDCVMDGVKMYKVTSEEVPMVSDGQERVVRPVIRLPEKNLVLTRINPEIRDTSVLVRLRPAWEDLRSYLIAKGRKRFEVYVCTMAERDYALEMWRLLDPEAHLIGPNQLLDRIVCVKSGARKSLFNVFQDGNCHPKMAMVIDDRMKVWEDKDQPRVHVVPAFTPYYAPQAETANAVPVLCVARNVACNVRGGFFKEFDENILRRISDLFYEDEVASLPAAPDASNYMMSEDASFVPNGSASAPMAEGMHGPEVAQRLNHLDDKNVTDSSTQSPNFGSERRPEISQLPFPPVPTVFGPASSRAVLPLEKPSLLGAPFKRDTSFSESDGDIKRRFLMNPSQEARYRGLEPPILSRLPVQVPVPHMHPQGGWLVEEDISRGHLNNQAGTIQGSDALRPDKWRERGRQNILSHSTLGPVPVGIQSHASAMKSEVGGQGQEVPKNNFPSASQLSEIGVPQNHRELQSEGGKVNSLSPSLYIGVLQEIGQRCSSRVDFKSVVSTSEHLQFSVEVLFSGEKIAFGMGKTRKDAQQQAAENALRSLADKYLSHIAPRSGAVDRDFDKLSLRNDNGFLWDAISTGSDELQVEDGLPKESTSEAAEVATPSSSSYVVNQQLQKRGNSPRLLQSNPSKRPKDEVLRGSQDLTSQPKNGHVVA